MGMLLTLARRSLTRRKLRSTLTVLAIVLGVANVFGVLVTNASIERGLEEGVRSFVAGADAVVYGTRGEPGGWVLSPDDFGRLRSLPGVRHVTAHWESFDSGLPDGVGPGLFVDAVDAAARETVIAEHLHTGRLFAVRAPEIVVSSQFARRYDLDIGGTWTTDLSRFREPSPDLAFALEPGAPDVLEFSVVGIVDDELGPKAFISLEHIWAVTHPDTATAARVYLDNDTDASEWTALVEPDHPDLTITSAVASPNLRRFLNQFTALLAGTAALALFVGAFLIHLVFSLTLVERTRHFGILHTIGATGRQVASVIVREALMLGALSTIVGVGVGVVLASVLTRLVAQIGQVPAVPGVVVTLGSLVAAVVVGMVATLVGAALPALRAARLDPVEALRGPSTSTGPQRVWVAGILMIASGTASVASRGLRNDLVSQASVVAVLLGAVLLTPALVAGLGRLLGTRGVRARSASRQLAFSYIARERHRSASTLALVMLALAAMLTLATSNASIQRSAERWIDARYGADLLLYGQVTPSVENSVESVEGVRGATAIGFGRRVTIVEPVRETQFLVLVEPDGFFDVARLPWVDGNDEDAREALRRGGNVLLPSRVAAQLSVRTGDRIALRSVGGTKRFAVAGVFATTADDPEAGVVASESDEAFFGAGERRNVLYVDYANDALPAAVLERLEEALEEDSEERTVTLTSRDAGQRLGPFVATTASEMKANARLELQPYFRLFGAVLLVAVVVGVLGMATSLAMSVLLRYRDIGALQAVGARPRDIRRMIVAESATLVLLAFALSVGLGVLLSWMFVQGVGSTAGFTMDLVLPWQAVPAVGVVAATIAVGAAAIPAARAARLSPVEALRYE